MISRRVALEKATKGKNAVHPIMISAAGLQPCKWSNDLSASLDVEVLFKL